MNVLILSPGADVAGMGFALAQAINRNADGWEARAVCRRKRVYDYQTDILWNGSTDRLVRRLFDRADIVHVMESPFFVFRFPGWQRKRIIVQQLGSRFRDDPAGMVQACEAVGATLVAGVPDRHYVDPPLPWLPGAVDTEALWSLRQREYMPSHHVRIVHAPTNRETKGTAAFLLAVSRLPYRDRLELDVIEGVPNAVCLRRKARADIYFDQVGLGFGLNAIEAWAMGIPVVAGVESSRDRAAMLADFGGLPWVEATEDTIGEALAYLIANQSKRDWLGEIGRQFVEQFFSEQAVAERAVAIYSGSAAVAA